MGEYFIVEYGKVYELCNRSDYVYCIVNKGTDVTEQIIQYLEDRYNATRISWIEFDRIKEKQGE